MDAVHNVMTICANALNDQERNSVTKAMEVEAEATKTYKIALKAANNANESANEAKKLSEIYEDTTSTEMANTSLESTKKLMMEIVKAEKAVKEANKNVDELKNEAVARVAQHLAKTKEFAKIAEEAKIELMNALNGLKTTTKSEITLKTTKDCKNVSKKAITAAKNAFEYANLAKDEAKTTKRAIAIRDAIKAREIAEKAKAFAENADKITNEIWIAEEKYNLEAIQKDKKEEETVEKAKIVNKSDTEKAENMIKLTDKDDKNTNMSDINIADKKNIQTGDVIESKLNDYDMSHTRNIHFHGNLEKHNDKLNDLNDHETKGVDVTELSIDETCKHQRATDYCINFNKNDFSKMCANLMKNGLCCKIAEKCLVNPQIKDEEYLQCVNHEINTSLPSCFKNRSFGRQTYFAAGGGILLLILMIVLYNTKSQNNTEESDIFIDDNEFYGPHKINIIHNDEIINTNFEEIQKSYDDEANLI
ncbi:Duffy receptor-like [Piliocolobus tephrosceles]|uniref:Duffy receptor-like n=1 Tax=Piliocolobus tephrosceles TaxID=591936 RepID=UPI000E6B0B00|nr:Duffy receptor-like [Piliocolobus tephrosceles]